MHRSWNKGLTKDTHLSLLKTSQTMKEKGIDNFSKWRKKMKSEGKIRSEYPSFKKDGDLAELIGVILGDGHIRKYPRTDELSIFSNSNNAGFINRYSKLVEKIFDKNPTLTKHANNNCIRIRIYQNNIQSRLDIPYSPRGLLSINIPTWILNDRYLIVRYLRGLYEAEGSHCIHKATSTYKVFFTNRNVSMLKNVYELVKGLGFHPHNSLYNVQLSRKQEVEDFLKLIEFRKY